MKAAILSIALLSVTATSFAQKSWVSLGISELSVSKGEQSTHYPGGISNGNSKTVNMIPVIGYNRFIGKNWGAGLEAGYRTNRLTNNSTGRDSVMAMNASGSTEIKSRSFYICPSLFENYEWKKFRGIASLSIPIEFLTDQQYSSKSVNDFESTSAADDERTSIMERPDKLIYGVFANLGVQRKIAGGLYFGPQLGFGFHCESSNGDIIQTNTYKTQGMPEQTDKSTTSIKDFSTGFSFRPGIAVAYYF